ncbi:MAG: hypothetical protein UU47_C0027G0004 [candidate division TM6 bacterium GW2011_GWE2_41_16]|nr:MAG: hypothetical protein UU47_C0027G0004 [candidate division TM6 bacterium GW2011_GWE2_41_16]
MNIKRSYQKVCLQLFCCASVLCMFTFNTSVWAMEQEAIKLPLLLPSVKTAIETTKAQKLDTTQEKNDYAAACAALRDDAINNRREAESMWYAHKIKHTGCEQHNCTWLTAQWCLRHIGKIAVYGVVGFFAYKKLKPFIRIMPQRTKTIAKLVLGGIVLAERSTAFIRDLCIIFHEGKISKRHEKLSTMPAPLK